MIKVEFPCTNSFCKNGMVNDLYARTAPGEESPLVTCNVCNGTGKRIGHFGATILIDVNMGDHAETRTEVIEFDPTISVQDMLKKIFDSSLYPLIISVTFSKGTIYD